MANSLEIAIVDDDSAIREALQDLLRSCGYATRCFASAEAFLAERGRRSFGCVILDMKMTGMSGLELQGELVCAGNEPPIIFLTSHFHEDMKKAALAAGAQAFLEKPVDDEILLECLRLALGA